MGGHGYIGTWGNMGGPTQRGITTYILSPFEQRAFAGAARKAVFNTSRRIISQIPYVGVAFGLGYVIYAGAISKHAYLTSKASHAAGEH
ncbi:UcrQ family protein [Spinellus fusiger]|nr:UcrQ family protein [Spinellus fusiger]